MSSAIGGGLLQKLAPAGHDWVFGCRERRVWLRSEMAAAIVDTAHVRRLAVDRAALAGQVDAVAIELPRQPNDASDLLRLVEIRPVVIHQRDKLIAATTECATGARNVSRLEAMVFQATRSKGLYVRAIHDESANGIFAILALAALRRGDLLGSAHKF